MIARVGSALSRFSGRWVPDPFVLALLLTLVVWAVGAIRMTGAGEASVLHSLAMGWPDGFALTGGLAFALQMCFILITGHAMALSEPIKLLGQPSPMPGLRYAESWRWLP